MRTYRLPFNKLFRSIIWISLGVLIGLLVFISRPAVHALPEYADRTNQQCTACHVNPAGGGPRTLRGLLWLAEGRPDEVPALPGSAQQDAAGGLSGEALFLKFECTLCHGTFGQGNVGPALNQIDWLSDRLADIIRNGSGAMQGYQSDKMSDEELEALVQYVQAIGRGQVRGDPGLERRLLPPPQLICNSYLSISAQTTCGAN